MQHRTNVIVRIAEFIADRDVPLDHDVADLLHELVDGEIAELRAMVDEREPFSLMVRQVTAATMERYRPAAPGG